MAGLRHRARRFPAVTGYEILEELGRGGMGVVYKARHVNSNRLVALKLIRDGALAGPQDRARFRIESVAAVRMQHPNIVQIYDAGEDQGRPFLSMEFVAGGSLDQQLLGEPQPAAHAAALVRALAIAVQHAHLQNVVHRDLKPANILLARAESESGDSSQTATRASPLTTHHPKITDFGLAKRLDSTSVAWTQDGAVLGTASYMAPEQASGQVQNIGPAVDIYALGAILFELLTGRPPFEADSWNQTIAQVLRDEPPPPTRLNPAVPRDLETICLKCLEKEPGRRYASAEELADDLGRFLESKPVTAVPLSAIERLARVAARDEYQLGDEIGRGPRSTVYRANHGPATRAIALKIFTHECLHQRRMGSMAPPRHRSLGRNLASEYRPRPTRRLVGRIAVCDARIRPERKPGRKAHRPTRSDPSDTPPGRVTGRSRCLPPPTRRRSRQPEAEQRVARCRWNSSRCRFPHHRRPRYQTDFRR